MYVCMYVFKMDMFMLKVAFIKRRYANRCESSLARGSVTVFRVACCIRESKGCLALQPVVGHFLGFSFHSGQHLAAREEEEEEIETAQP